MIDLEAYADRIQYTGPLEPSLAALRQLHRRHALAIGFENIDSFLGHTVAIDLATVFAKLVTNRRGGYCFEQNTLFFAVLEQIGFAVQRLSCRIRWMQPPEAPPAPRGHFAIEAQVNGEAYLCDVGFGGQLFAAPLPFIADREQISLGALRRLRRDGDFWLLQTRWGEQWHDVYRFNREPAYPADFEVANWYTCTHPQSLFRTNLMMERLREHDRISLLGRRLRRRGHDGDLAESTIESAAGFETLLRDEFAAPADLAAALWPGLPG